MKLDKTYRLLLAASFIAVSTTACIRSSEQGEQNVFGYKDNGKSPVSYDLEDIQMNGELIVLTLYGPTSYFDFKGENFGHHYKLAEAYSQSIGTSLRVDVCRSTRELLDKLETGEGDLVAYQLDTALLDDQTVGCGSRELTLLMDSLAKSQPGMDSTASGVAWAVRAASPHLAQSVESWLHDNGNRFFELTTPKFTDTAGKTYQPRIHRSRPAINLARGEISVYDNIFQRHASTCGWDWKLLAAQAYQESGFDPCAVSYMGALGLMQLMPATARSVGVDMTRVFDAESNVRGAVKLLRQLQAHYVGIPDPTERIKFVLAAYNAGPGHVDDARRLAATKGMDPDVWTGQVENIAIHFSESDYYNHPTVKNGYFRGQETCGYVNAIISRWHSYRR